MLSEGKSLSLIHLRAIANDLSSDIIFLSYQIFYFFLKDEPFSDDDPLDYIEEESDIMDGIIPDNLLFQSMDSSEINNAVQEVNQKITEKSKKTNKIQNPIKVLVKKLKKQILIFFKVSKQKRRFKLDGFNLDLTCFP